MALIVFVGTLLSFLTSSSLFGVSSSLLLLGSLRHFFLRTRYTIDGHGVSVSCLGVETRRTWPRLRRFRHDDAGAFLSTRARPSLLDTFNGLHLTWAGNKKKVVPVIEQYIATSRNRS